MATIDYKQKIKDYMNSSEVDTLYKSMLSNLFPELKESKDEKIRQELIIYLKAHIGETLYHTMRFPEWIAWLEKQKTSEEALQYLRENHSSSEMSDFQAAMNIAVAKAYDKGYNDGLEKQGEQKSIDELTQQEAMDIAVAKCFEQGEQKQDVNMQIEPSEYINDMGGNGCYLKKADKWELVEQNPAWSGEDENILRTIISDGIRGAEFDMLQIDWLKSLKDRVQPKQEWSEEDEIAFDDALWCCKQAASIAKDENDMGSVWYAENWLQYLKDRYTWKPSEEQMKALTFACIKNAGIDKSSIKALYDLKEQLKKLREE